MKLDQVDGPTAIFDPKQGPVFGLGDLALELSNPITNSKLSSANLSCSFPLPARIRMYGVTNSLLMTGTSQFPLSECEIIQIKLS